MKLPKTLAAMALFVAVFAALIAGLSAVQSRMSAIRIDEQLTDTEPLENAPPMVVLTTVALGGFRGLAADWLWLRSNRMQELGNYFEMVQLASWIIKLQPRFTGAAAFLAWNMAYNVSVTFTSPEDRWRWVRRGIELIRDEALEYNPGDPELFQQLGWIYQHKMGRDLDDANRFYKTQFAMEMIMVFGDYAGRWDMIGRAAPTEAKLRDQLGAPDFWNLLAVNGLTFETLEKDFRKTGLLPETIVAELGRLGILEPVELCLRRRWLDQKYRLIPELILRLNEEYGPLDWRLPEAHAIYWASRGKEQWDKHENDFKRLQCDRMIFQSLYAAFQGGRLVYLKDVQMLTMTPNTALVDSTRGMYEEAMATHPDSNISGAYMNFMVEAIVSLYKFGNKQKAVQYQADARKLFSGNRFDGDTDEFVLRELGEDLKSPSYNHAQSTIQAYIKQMCYSIAFGETEQAAYYDIFARKIHGNYMKFIGESTYQRRALAPIDELKRTYINGPLKTEMPPQLYQLLWAQLPDGLKVKDQFNLGSKAGIVDAPPGTPVTPPGEAPKPEGQAPKP